MSFLNKFGIGAAAGASTSSRAVPPAMASTGKPRAGGPAPLAAVGVTRAPEPVESNRVSNGLKEFLWNLDGLGRGTLLDLGPAWQTTLNFFIERGFRVSSEDILRGWKDFLAEEDAKLREAAGRAAQHTLDVSPAARAARFLEANLRYPNASFDAILLWDLLDYLEPLVAKQLVANLTDVLRPGGIVLAMFHSKKPLGFQRYRVMDSSTLQVVSSPVLCPAQRVYQNREIQDLFSRYRTVKSFVGRDQLRESLFIK
jgi:SAM-dependent methyltransferase